ncbi:keratin-associated protein 10-7 [Verticillium alfalfae VaMs.102]|uniref:Keratin-associated protein 10-7 n=1 Tax=Verticillium alfalfae (strain VaMs.102 / ATCC MYA-4576 / FGSC 10136) TaxID=526221 RepID=C9SHU2_VERA1|nr:keratin-associated protein 10-7 [Verticillium alfalfae VaMs.102]EEY18515.1 keratin-associated protein 10-7 [Verticillium alfalfae VaMs.102]
MSEACIGGTCIPIDPRDKCRPRCFGGAACLNGVCVPTRGAGACSQTCVEGSVCFGGECQPIQTPKECAPNCARGSVCIAGFCQPIQAPIDCGLRGRNCPLDTNCLAGNCVPIRDPNSCTDDGKPCPSNHRCVQGQCVPTRVSGCNPACESDTEICVDGVCSAIKDPSSCGSGGGKCLPGHMCAGEQCLPIIGSTGCTSKGRDCEDGFVCVAKNCVPVSSPNDCGEGGTQCADGELCLAGRCTAQARPDPSAECTDPACKTGEICIDGSCTTLTDPAACGSSGEPCPAGTFCLGDVCTRLGDPTDCDRNGLTCDAGAICAAGTCVPAQSPTNCGGPGQICPAGQQCFAGQCLQFQDAKGCGTGIACGTGQQCIHGTCVSIGVTQDCGDTGAPCKATENCVEGSCRLLPVTGACGTTGGPCPVGNKCVAGACVLPSDPVPAVLLGRLAAAGASVSTAVVLPLMILMVTAAAPEGRVPSPRSVRAATGPETPCGQTNEPCPRGATCVGGACLPGAGDGDNCGDTGGPCENGLSCIAGVCFGNVDEVPSPPGDLPVSGGDQPIPGGDQSTPGGGQTVPGTDQPIPGGDQSLPGPVDGITKPVIPGDGSQPIGSPDLPIVADPNNPTTGGGGVSVPPATGSTPPVDTCGLPDSAVLRDYSASRTDVSFHAAPDDFCGTSGQVCPIWQTMRVRSVLGPLLGLLITAVTRELRAPAGQFCAGESCLTIGAPTDLCGPLGRHASRPPRELAAAREARPVPTALSVRMPQCIISPKDTCGPGRGPCHDGLVCQDGVCTPTGLPIGGCEGLNTPCASGLICVSDICVVDPDPSTCSGAVCGTGELCVHGLCIDILNNACTAAPRTRLALRTTFAVPVPVLRPPTAFCGDTTCDSQLQVCVENVCLALSTDLNNCGAAGTTCQAGQTCISGQCSDPAAPTDCGGDVCGTGELCVEGTICVNLATDNKNCGSTGTVCSIDQVCVFGVCTALTAPVCGQTNCAEGQICSSATCLDVFTDAANCGAEGRACEPSGSTCVAGKCVPPVLGQCGSTTCAAFESCRDGTCYDHLGDVDNCGGLGKSCSGTCVSGNCVPLPAVEPNQPRQITDTLNQVVNDALGPSGLVPSLLDNIGKGQTSNLVPDIIKGALGDGTSTGGGLLPGILDNLVNQGAIPPAAVTDLIGPNGSLPPLVDSLQDSIAKDSTGNITNTVLPPLLEGLIGDGTTEGAGLIPGLLDDISKGNLGNVLPGLIDGLIGSGTPGQGTVGILPPLITDILGPAADNPLGNIGTIVPGGLGAAIGNVTTPEQLQEVLPGAVGDLLNGTLPEDVVNGVIGGLNNTVTIPNTGTVPATNLPGDAVGGLLDELLNNATSPDVPNIPAASGPLIDSLLNGKPPVNTLPVIPGGSTGELPVVGGLVENGTLPANITGDTVVGAIIGGLLNNGTVLPGSPTAELLDGLTGGLTGNNASVPDTPAGNLGSTLGGLINATAPIGSAAGDLLTGLIGGVTGNNTDITPKNPAGAVGTIVGDLIKNGTTLPGTPLGDALGGITGPNPPTGNELGECLDDLLPNGPPAGIPAIPTPEELEGLVEGLKPVVTAPGVIPPSGGFIGGIIGGVLNNGTGIGAPELPTIGINLPALIDFTLGGTNVTGSDVPGLNVTLPAIFEGLLTKWHH